MDECKPLFSIFSEDRLRFDSCLFCLQEDKTSAAAPGPLACNTMTTRPDVSGIGVPPITYHPAYALAARAAPRSNTSPFPSLNECGIEYSVRIRRSADLTREASF